MSKRDFSDLQNESKWLKPASFSKLLGKRDWKLHQIPQLETSYHSLSNQEKIKNRKLKRSRSFGDEMQSSSTSAQENNLKISLNTLTNPGQSSRGYQKKNAQIKKQVNLGLNQLSGFPTADNFERYMAYNLSKNSTKIYILNHKFLLLSNFSKKAEHF